jgi:hypothetical protein
MLSTCSTIIPFITQPISTQTMQAYLLNRITSPLRRPDPLNLFHQPLRNSSIDLRRFLLSHPMRRRIFAVNFGFCAVAHTES